MAGGIEFDWDAGNTKHLAAHGVMPAEFEQLLNNDPLDLDFEMTEGEDRFRSVGVTNKRAVPGRGVDDSEWKSPRHYRVSGRSFEPEGVSGEIAMKKQTKRVVSAFATEAQEAEWWYENRRIHDSQLRAALKSGEAQVLTKEKLLERIAAAKKTPAQVVALRIPREDLALARKQAGEKGLPYQTYIKSVLHETLAAREKRRAG